MQVSHQPSPPPPQGAPPPPADYPQQNIVIQPTNPEVVHVPQYDPQVVYGGWGYSTPPVYWPPPPAYYGYYPGYYPGAALAAGFMWGAGMAIAGGLWGWANAGWGWGGGGVYNNINVNAICPGVTRTALSDANLAVAAQQQGVTLEEMERRRADVIPLKRANGPEDVAAMVVFLASSGARNITGQSFNVDGGLILD